MSTLTRWVMAPSTASDEASHSGVAPNVTRPLSTTCKVLPRARPVSPLPGTSPIRLVPPAVPTKAWYSGPLMVVKLLISGMFSR
ncbi:hypothetical protein D3C80_1538380 [compost metagenome]